MHDYLVFQSKIFHWKQDSRGSKNNLEIPKELYLSQPDPKLLWDNLEPHLSTKSRWVSEEKFLKNILTTLMEKTFISFKPAFCVA